MISTAENTLIDAIDREELIELTRNLIRIDSVIRPETGNTEREAVRFIAGWIEKQLRIPAVIEEVEPGRENIIALIDSGRQGRCLLLEGHTDVVSEGDPAEWVHPPF